MAHTAPVRPAPHSAPASERARAFFVSRASDGGFKRRGLRSYFEYRDLGIAKASDGSVVAHVIRARPETAPHGEWHSHACNLQFVYVLKGWVRFEYEGVGVVTMKKGDCFVQPPNILHREIPHSKNLELIEIVAPANFETHEPTTARKAAKKSAKRAARV